MKKIIIFLITFFLSISTLFAENTVEISVSNKTVQTWENINLQININSDIQGNIEITEINGIDNFDQVSQSQSKQVQIINWNSSSIHTLNLWLQANNTGSYILWPVSVQFWDELIHSDPIEVYVEDLNIPRIDKKEQININLENKNNLNSEKKSENNSNNNLLSDVEEKSDNHNNMTDIHGVKKLDINFSSFQYTGVIYWIIIILFFIIFYLFLLKVLSHKKISDNNKKLLQEGIDRKKQEIDDINNELLLLSDKSEEYSQEEFYTQLNDLFRRYFLYIHINNADKKTLTELQKENIDSKLLDIFSTSYMFEFSTKQDSLSERKQIIMNFMLYLRK